jgi:hypothetical protein
MRAWKPLAAPCFLIPDRYRICWLNGFIDLKHLSAYKDVANGWTGSACRSSIEVSFTKVLDAELE